MRPVTICAALFCAAVFFSSAAGAASRLFFAQAGVENGLSSNNIQAITQDDQGFVWLGTALGLSCYDGSNFIVYRHRPGDGNSLRANNITALAPGGDNDIYVGTRGGLIDRYVRDKMAFFPVAPEIFADGRIFALCKDGEGRLWVSSSHGLYFEQSGGFIKIAPENIAAGGQQQVSAMALATDGALWLASDRGLLKRDRGGQVIEVFKNGAAGSDNDFTCICLLRNGMVLLGTKDAGAFLFNPADGAFSPLSAVFDHPADSIGQNITAVSQDNDGALWVGTQESGLSVIAGKEARKYRADFTQGSLNNNRIKSIFVTRQNRVFVGTVSGGLNFYDRNNFFFPEVNRLWGGLSGDAVYGFARAGDDGSLWVATEGGVDLWREDRGVYKRYRHSASNSATINANQTSGLYVDKSGALWVTTARGAAVYDKGSDCFWRLALPQGVSGIAPEDIRNVFEDKSGAYWYGSGNGLIYHHPASGRVKVYKHRPGDANSLPGSGIRRVFEDNDGYVWISTYYGLSRFSPAQEYFEHFSASQPDGMHSNILHAFFEDSDHIWLGLANGGLCRYDKRFGRMTNVPLSWDNSDISVYSILEGEGGLLWLASNYGIISFDRSSGEVLGRLDLYAGRQNYEFNSGAAYKDGELRLFFGGVDGFKYFSPQMIKDAPAPAPFICTGIEADLEPVSGFNRYVNSDEPLVLEYDEARLKVSFALLGYMSSGSYVYRYKLEGHDKDWINSQNNFIQYETLLPGNYKLLVAGPIGSAPLRVNISVKKPWWQSWWAISLYIASLSLAGGQIFLTQHKKSLEVAERQRQLSENIADKTKELKIIIQLLDEKNKKLYFLGMHDELTGFFNRKRFADVEWDFDKGLFTDDKLPLCIIMVDVDGLKTTNDQLGHVYGDQLLQTVARMLKASLRKEDIACRIGGDEFALFVLHCQENTLRQILDRIEAERKIYNDGENNPLYISFSIGYAFLGRAGSFKAAFEAADAMMYENKVKTKPATSELILKKVLKTKETI